MSKLKKNLYEKSDTTLAEVSKSLAHPARVQILKLLLVKSPQNCSQIVEQLPLAQATVSQHLSELKYSGLISDKKDGNMVLYSANKESVAKAHSMFIDLFLGYSKNLKQQKLF